MDTDSLSRSPSRRQQFTDREINPLLANLSPESTLAALQATDAVSTRQLKRQNSIQKSVEVASASDRIWGIRTALAGKKIRQWYGEVAAWPWPHVLQGQDNGFDQHSQAESVATKTTDGHEVGNIHEEEYWGNLPEPIAQAYRDRLDAIRDDMDTLEVEDLKNYVRDVHLKAESRRSSLLGMPSQTASYDHLDDFTAMITANIVQALPTLSRLNTLLSQWSTRLAILRLVPSFLTDLETCQQSMHTAWIAIGGPGSSRRRRPSFSRKPFTDVRAVLQDQITELGWTLDTMLDLMEGSEDTLPENWIDGMDNLENEYGSWVVKAEELVWSHEIDLDQTGKKLSSSPAAVGRADLKLRQIVEPGEAESYSGPSQFLVGGAVDLVESTGSNSLGAESDPLDRGVEDENRELPQLPQPPQPRDYNSSPKQIPGTATPQHDYDPISIHVPGTPTPSHDQKTNHDQVPVAPTQPLAHNITSNHFSHTSTQSQPHNISPDQIDSALNSPVGNVQTDPGNTTVSGHEDLEDSSRNLADTTKFTTSLDAIQPEKIVSQKPEQTILERRQKLNHTPAPLTLEDPPSDAESDISQTGSATSDYFSNRSSPVIESATVAAYLGSPVEVSTPPWASRESVIDKASRCSSIYTERSDIRQSQTALSPGRGSPVVRRNRAVTYSPDSSTFKGLSNNEARVPELPEGHTRVRSASLQSFEKVSRDEIRRLIVRRSGSHSPAVVTPVNGRSAAGIMDDGEQWSRQRPLSTSFLLDEASLRFVAPEVPPEKQLRQALSPLTEISDKVASTNSIEHQTLFAELAHQSEEVEASGSGFPPLTMEEQEMTPTADPVTPQKKLKGPEKRTPKQVDKLEARINSILTDLPAEIRFMSGDATPPAGTRSRTVSNPRTPGVRSFTPRLLRSTPPPSLTLAPAPITEPRPRAQDGEPEIKVYHLRQAGKDVPIKLYVRLVGEAGERVMVRVGGGWADLGEYLKEYALHHGKRTVSDAPRFDIHGLPSSSPISSPAPPSSRPGTPSSSARPSPANLSIFKRSRTSSPASAMFSSPMTPSSRTVSSYETSTPSTLDEDTPSLAGPKKKKVEISPSKQAWVDDMLHQARITNAEKATEKKQGPIGLLGKVGATKKVFLRSKTEG